MYLRDGGERERMRERLRMERLLAEALAMTKIAYWSWDLETDNLTWSPYLRDIYDVKPDTVATYDQWLNLIHPDDRAHADAICQFAAHAGSPYVMDYRVIGNDGQERLIRETAVTSADGTLMVGTCKLLAPVDRNAALTHP